MFDTALDDKYPRIKFLASALTLPETHTLAQRLALRRQNKDHVTRNLAAERNSEIKTGTHTHHPHNLALGKCNREKIFLLDYGRLVWPKSQFVPFL